MSKSLTKRKAAIVNSRFPIVGIGASAGGLDAIKEFFTAMPNTTGMAFVVVQHLDPKHGSLAAEILARTTEMPVRDIKSGQRVKPNEVYVIPSNHALEIRKGLLKLTPRKDGYGQQRVIDSFLVSLAEDLGEQAIGVILSGTANDGTVGLRSIKSAGGLAVAQDPTSAKFDGMPKSAIASGVVDFVLPPAEMAQELARIAEHHGQPRPKSLVPKEDLEDSLRQLFAILRARTHVDFSNYKRSTLMRRIERRMTVRRSQSLAEYVGYVNTHPEESRALFDDILINVTEFFRDEDSFKVLSDSILPKLFKGRDENSPIRVWVPGCSSGEEVYSIAISLLEYQEKKGDSNSHTDFRHRYQ